MQEKDERRIVDRMSCDIEEYLQNVAGVGCPPECSHFSPISTSGCDAGCQLDKLHPWDCLEANVHDLSRWLVAQGWKEPDKSHVIFSTDGA